MQKNNVVLSIFKGVLSLSIIALVCTVLLGVMNIVTYVDPLTQAREKFTQFSGGKTFSSMLEENWSRDNGKILYYAQSTDGTTNAFLAQGKGGYGGPVEVYVIINVENKIIEKVKLGNHSETFIPDLNKDNYFDKFVGKNIASFTSSDVDKVSGASLSSNAVKDAILVVTKYYNTYPEKVNKQEQGNGGGTKETPPAPNDGSTTTKNYSKTLQQTTANNKAEIGRGNLENTRQKFAKGLQTLFLQDKTNNEKEGHFNG